MKLRSLLCILLLAAAPGWTAGAAEPPVEDFSPLPPEEAAAPVLPPGSTAAATELSASSRCHPTKRRAALVALRWRPEAGEDAPRGTQRVETTKFRDGFRTGRLTTTRRLAAEVDAVAVDSPETGIVYYWRVLTRTPQGWASSAIERFEVPICPWDGSDPSRLEAALSDARQDPDPELR